MLNKNNKWGNRCLILFVGGMFLFLLAVETGLITNQTLEGVLWPEGEEVLPTEARVACPPGGQIIFEYEGLRGLPIIELNGEVIDTTFAVTTYAFPKRYSLAVYLQEGCADTQRPALVGLEWDPDKKIFWIEEVLE